MGKYYYATSGSITDIIADTESLVNMLVERYSGFPKRVENERTDDWISRSDRSLDYTYSERMQAKSIQ